jgi:DNA-binding HxlR family transcriptional regulator
MKKVRRRSDCPINFALEIFGDRWALLVVRDLMFKDKMYYGDFLGSEEKISTNILADRLETLACAGIVKKLQDPQNKAKYIYSMTSKGLDLAPVLIEIILWSAKYDRKTATPKEFVVAARNDRDGLIKKVRANLKSKALSKTRDR